MEYILTMTLNTTRTLSMQEQFNITKAIQINVEKIEKDDDELYVNMSGLKIEIKRQIEK
jgi:hypothetical protein